MSALRTVEEYLDKITARWRYKPKYLAMMQLILQPFIDAQNTQALLGSYYFDLDTAVGVQLDAVGVRVGLSRYVTSPLANVYFAWSDPLRGWGRGVWYDADYGNEYGVTRLDDDTYRRLLRAKILANQWDGTLPGVQAIVDVFFDSPTQTLAIVQDDCTDANVNVYFAWSDPNAGWSGAASSGGQRSQWFLPGDVVATTTAVGVGFTIGVAGHLPALPLLFLLEQQMVPVKALGAPVRYAFTSRDGAPLFGWGVNNQYVSGWGKGAWGVDAATILNAPPASIYPVTEAA